MYKVILVGVSFVDEALTDARRKQLVIVQSLTRSGEFWPALVKAYWGVEYVSRPSGGNRCSRCGVAGAACEPLSLVVVFVVQPLSV